MRGSIGTVLLCCFPVLVWGQQFIPLGPPPGYTTDARAISPDGFTVVLSNQEVVGIHSYRWTQESGYRDLGTLGGSICYANGASDGGRVIVGESMVAPYITHAFTWTETAGMLDIGTLGGVVFNYSKANNVSSDGATVVGVSNDPTDAGRAFRWRNDLGMQSLGTLGGYWSEATSVSDDGTIVGSSVYFDGVGNYWRAFRWTEETGMQQVGALAGSNDNHAQDISQDSSTIVGYATTYTGLTRAFRHTAFGGMQDIGNLGGYYSQAAATSFDGSVVVGGSQGPDYVYRAFVWTEVNGMQDINVLYANVIPMGWRLLNAVDVSGDGRFITGTAITSSGNRQGWWLDTVPEPSALLMMSVGVLGIGLRLRLARCPD